MDDEARSTAISGPKKIAPNKKQCDLTFGAGAAAWSAYQLIRFTVKFLQAGRRIARILWRAINQQTKHTLLFQFLRPLGPASLVSICETSPNSARN